MSAFLNGRVVGLFHEQSGKSAGVSAAVEAGASPAPTAAENQEESTPSPASAGLLKLASTLTIVLGMAFVIYTLSNLPVRLSAALLGGAVAGLLWQLLQFFSVYVQIWLAGKNAIYSSLAAIPMLMIWIYLSWTILLVGAEAACAYQTEPAVTTLTRTGKIDQRLRETVAARLCVRVSGAFLAGQGGPSAEGLASDLGIAPRVVTQVLDALVAAALLARTSDGEQERYLPARDPGALCLLDVVRALRTGSGSRPPEPRSELDRIVDQARGRLEDAAAESAANKTLRELAESVPFDGESPSTNR